MAPPWLKKLPIGWEWGLESGDGTWSLASPIYQKDGRKLLSSYILLAVALTSACCERGAGKVYCVHRNCKLLPKLNQDPDKYEVYSNCMKEPGLVYVVEDWDSESQEEWRAMRPENQIGHCWAPHGWVHKKAMVLPFTAVVHNTSTAVYEPLKRARLLAATNAPVLVCVTGTTVFAGLTNEMIRGCRRKTKHTADGHLIRDDYRLRCSRLTSWKVEGSGGVIKFLESLSTGRQDLFVVHRTLQDRLSDAKRNMIAARKRVEDAESAE